MTLRPATLDGEEGMQRLMEIICTWSALKHWHIQFNIIINKQVLAAAHGAPLHLP